MLLLALIIGWFWVLQQANECGFLPLAGQIATLIGLFLALIGNVAQYKYGKGELIHKTDTRTIASLQNALAQSEREVGELKPQAEELPKVKRELVAHMSINAQELLEFAAMKRRITALERECEALTGELAQARRGKTEG